MPITDKLQLNAVTLSAVQVNDKCIVGRPSIISVADSSITIDENNNEEMTAAVS